MQRLLLYLLLFSWVVVPVQAQSTDAPQFHQLRVIERPYFYYPPVFTEGFSFNSDGTRLAAAASESTVNIWDVTTGDVVRSLPDVSASVEWSPDDAWIATAMTEGIRIWNAETGIVAYDVPQGDYLSSGSVGWSPDSRHFLTNDGTVHDARTGQSVLRLVGAWTDIHHMYWSPDGTKIVMASDGRETDFVYLWSSDGQLLDTYWGGITVSWSPDSKYLASDGQVRDVSTGLPITIIPHMGHMIAWHPREAWIASSAVLGDAVDLWDATSGELLTSWTIPGCFIQGLTWSPKGDRFAVSCEL